MEIVVSKKLLAHIQLSKLIQLLLSLEKIAVLNKSGLQHLIT